MSPTIRLYVQADFSLKDVGWTIIIMLEAFRAPIVFACLGTMTKVYGRVTFPKGLHKARYH